MTGKWPYKRVEEIALKVAMGPFGSSIKVETFTDTGIPIISGQHLREAELTDSEFNFIAEEHADSLKNANVQRGDVIFTHAGNIGQVAFIPNDSKYQRYVISQRQFYLRCDTSLILPEFITYYFKSSEGQHKLLANANQVGVPSIARPSSYLKTIEVPVPSIEEQQIVVRNIKALDAKIRANRRINQTLEAMAQAIFKSWFVDFDPVKAKITAIEQGQDPLRAAMRAISGKTDAELDQMPREHHDQLAATATLFPDAMEESELGEIPKGWEVSDFGSVSVCFDKNRIPLSKRQRENRKGNVPYYGATSVMDYVDEHIFDGVFLLLGEDGSVLKEDGTPFVQYIWGKSWVNNHAHVLQGSNGVSTEQLMIFISMQNISAYVTGAVQLKLNQKNMNSIPFVKASNEVNCRFSEVIAPVFTQHRLLVEGIRDLAELRDTLLPKLLSGELRIPDTEAAL